MTGPVHRIHRGTWALSVLLAMVGSAGGAEEVPSTVPRGLRKEARKVFDAGKPYFLWTTAKPPLRGMTLPGIGSVATLPVSYQRRPGALGTEFQVRAEVQAVRTNREGGTVNFMTSGAVPADSPAGTRDLLVGSKDALSGAGVARVYLVRKDAPAKEGAREELSNVLEMRVDFGNSP